MDTQDCPDSMIHGQGSSHLNEESIRTCGQRGDIQDTSFDKFQSNVTDQSRIERERQRHLREEHKIGNSDQIASAALPGTHVSAADERPKSPDKYPSLSYRSRHLSRSASPDCIDQSDPRISSLSPSSIFERDVQKDLLSVHTSPSIPSHISMENHIPPVLEASSVAITDDRLSPDTVEIVTHNVHQSATAGVCGAFAVEPSLPSTCFEHFRDGSEDLEEPHLPCKALESTNLPISCLVVAPLTSHPQSETVLHRHYVHQGFFTNWIHIRSLAPRIRSRHQTFLQVEKILLQVVHDWPLKGQATLTSVASLA
ncbi:hypothetical protein V6000_004333 [Aspergillus fumigatus]